jgi:hypothetical protein
LSRSSWRDGLSADQEYKVKVFGEPPAVAEISDGEAPLCSARVEGGLRRPPSSRPPSSPRGDPEFVAEYLQSVRHHN